MIKIKGSGDTREVYRDGVLVGRIHRIEREEESVSISPSRMRRSKRTVVMWSATWPSGGIVRWPPRDGKKPRHKILERLKDWQVESAWTSVADDEMPESVPAGAVSATEIVVVEMNVAVRAGQT